MRSAVTDLLTPCTAARTSLTGGLVLLGCRRRKGKREKVLSWGILRNLGAADSLKRAVSLTPHVSAAISCKTLQR